MRRRQFLHGSGTALATVLGVAGAAGASPPASRSRAHDPAVRELTARSAPGAPREERHEVERDGELLHVSGSVVGSDGCAAVALAGVRGGGDRAVVDLSRVDDGGVCLAAETPVAYDLTLAFDGDPPTDVDVRVSDAALERPLVRSASFAAGEEYGEGHEVERRPGLDRAVVAGTLHAPDSCAGFQYAGTEFRGDEATVVLESHRPEGVCLPAETPIDYELELAFPRGLPDAVDVEVR